MPAPDAPTIGTVSCVLSSFAAVAFTPPLNDGGSAITGYTATSTPGGLTGSAATSPIIVAGLTAGTPYTFTVHATNADGNSVESAASASFLCPGTSFIADSPYVCGWAMDSACCSELATAFANEATLDLAQAVINQAAEILYALSGRQFGLCEVTVRPCREDCCNGCEGPFSSYPWFPVLENGAWRNVRCSTCTGACSCSRICEVSLPGPIDSVVEVLLDGAALVENTDYRVDNHTSLVRLGGDCWPTCQEMSLPTTDVGTWGVTYLRGLPLPAAGTRAFEALACELYKACAGDTTCCLPARVSQVVRQGITMTMLDPMDFLDKGRTGIYAVDIWLASVNPKGRSRRAHVFSPDVEPTRHTTWPA